MPRTPALIASLLALLSHPALADERDAHRIAGILDYVAGDYGLAVRDGKVVSASEYEEQLGFVRSARQLLAALRDPRARAIRPAVNAGLDALEAAIRRVAPPGEVARLAGRAKAALVKGLDLVLAPSRPPSLERARELFAQACSECHGQTGRADGRRAAELKPPPASFHAPERMEGLTPYRVFNAITFGIQGTAMASFEEALKPDDRWSLAFYVLALRHLERPADGPLPPPLPRSTLATASDADLRRRLLESGVSREHVPGALAVLRTRRTFDASDHERSLARAGELVEEALAAFRRGDREAASRHAIDAYLEGFEAAEVPLRVRDAELVRRVEGAFVALRHAVTGEDAAVVNEAAAAVRRGLRDAMDVLTGRPGTAAVAFFGSFLILFREGIEAALLIGALLGILSRTGRRGAARWVHGGWIAALVAGVATWAVAQQLVRMSSARRELLEGTLSLAAAVILFSVSYWLISKLDVQRWIAFLKSRVSESAGRPRGLWAVAGIAFLAVYREVFETVLFYQALLLDARGEALAVAAGALAGVVVLCAAVWVIFRLGNRLPLSAFFLGSGILLCGLAAVLAGKGVRAMQAGGVFPYMPVGLPQVDWLGLYPDGLSVAVQAAIVTALLGAAAWALVRRKKEGEAATSP